MDSLVLQVPTPKGTRYDCQRHAPGFTFARAQSVNAPFPKRGGDDL